MDAALTGRFRSPQVRLPIPLLLISAAAMLGAGCAAVRPPASHPAPAVLPSAASLDAALAARRDTVHSLRALAHLRYRHASESQASREAIVVARPDRIRVEVLSLFGSVFVLTAENGTLTAYARQEDTVYRGQASPENLGRYAQLELPVNELVDIVLATPPPLPGRHVQVAFDSVLGATCLSQAVDESTRVVCFSEATLPVVTEERDAAGQARWRANFAEYEDHGGVPVATRIGLELPAWSRSVQIALEDVDLNPTLDQSIFALQTPPGSRVVDLDHVTD